MLSRPWCRAPPAPAGNFNCISNPQERSWGPKAYTWVTDLTEIEPACLTEHGILPLLRPNEISRVHRWERILHWYGLRYLDKPDFKPKEIADNNQRPRDLIAALDDEAYRVASVISAADGRAIIRAKDVGTVCERASQRGVRSLLLVARSFALNNCALAQASARLRLPWGIITGRDLPALTFALAKVFAARRPIEHSNAHLDAISRKMSSRHSNGRFGGDRMMMVSNTWNILRDSEWNTVTIHCHGDGAHANFNSVVLCGVADREEMGIGGWRGACTLNADPPQCKRVHGHERRALRFGDVRARQICLFTCNGFSVAGDVYPSEASFVLSAVEGYPSALLTTDRRLRFEPWLFTAVHTLIEGQQRLGTIVAILNDLCGFTEGVRPYLLHGDPLETAADIAGARNREFHSSVRIYRLAKLAKCAVIGFKGHQHSTLKRGLSKALLVQADHPSNVTRLVDRTGDFDRVRRWLTHFGVRVQRARRLIAAIDYYHGGHLSETDSVAETFDEMVAISSELEKSVNEANRLIEVMRETGVWLGEIVPWREHALLLVLMWNTHFATFLDQYLLERNLPEVLRDGFYRVSRSTRSSCPRCGCPLIHGLGRAEFLSAVKHNWVDCPTCGPRESWDLSLPRLEAGAPAAVFGGGITNFTVRWSASEVLLEPSGFLIVHLKDSGRSRVTFRILRRTLRQSCRIHIPIPKETTLEIQTLRVALVRDLGVSYLRLRTPCLPRSALVYA